ncbi:MAG: DUF6969 family protein, partial [Gemmobacter sp.]
GRVVRARHEAHARLLRLRGEAMQKATPPGTGAMAALLGAEIDLARAICAKAATDPETGATWFYHCHPREAPAPAEEHGHFHCFVRPEGKGGPIHHLIAIGVDAHGRPLRLFTVNQWVTGENWVPAETAIGLLERFDVHLARPDYLVNRWLTAMVRLHERQIAALIEARDAALAGLGEGAREDRSREVLSEAMLTPPAG